MLQRQEKRAALRRVLVRGAIAVVVAAVLAGGWFGYSKWSESRERAAQADGDRLEAERKERQTRDRAEASKALSDAGEELARLRSGIAGITTEPQRGQAPVRLRHGDREDKRGWKARPGQWRRRTSAGDGLNLKPRFEACPSRKFLAASTGGPDGAECNAEIDSRRSPFQRGGPHGPLAEVDRGLQRADHGIGLAKSVLAGDPGHAETRLSWGSSSPRERRWSVGSRSCAPTARGRASGKRPIWHRRRRCSTRRRRLSKSKRGARGGAGGHRPGCKNSWTAILRDDLHQRDALTLRTRTTGSREGSTNSRTRNRKKSPSRSKR